MARLKPNASIELLAPAGSWEALRAALSAGADAVYFGVGKLNMRARAAMNFKECDLEDIMSACHERGVRGYLTINNVIYDSELPDLDRLIGLAAEAGVDAVICHDLAVIQRVANAGLPVHLSTQANISNIEAVAFHAQFADVVVLARELNLEQIRSIAESVVSRSLRGPSGELVRLEAFVHGALCVAVSGKCGMSLAQTNHSANRGDCLQSCRRSYRVTDTQTGEELVVDNEYVMSPRDLCTIVCLDEILESGISVLKIEGRGRSADYVSTVVSCYREAIESVAGASFSEEKVADWTERLRKVFNRGFWEGGYYMGRATEQWSGYSGNRATERKMQVGVVHNFFGGAGVAEIRIQNIGLKRGEAVMVTGPTTGVLRFCPDELRVNEECRGEANPGDHVTCRVPEKVRRNDKVFVVRSGKPEDVRVS